MRKIASSSLPWGPRPGWSPLLLGHASSCRATKKGGDTLPDRHDLWANCALWDCRIPTTDRHDLDVCKTAPRISPHRVKPRVRNPLGTRYYEFWGRGDSMNFEGGDLTKLQATRRAWLARPRVRCAVSQPIGWDLLVLTRLLLECFLKGLLEELTHEVGCPGSGSRIGRSSRLAPQRGGHIIGVNPDSVRSAVAADLRRLLVLAGVRSSFLALLACTSAQGQTNRRSHKKHERMSLGRWGCGAGVVGRVRGGKVRLLRGQSEPSVAAGTRVPVAAGAWRPADAEPR